MAADPRLTNLMASAAANAVVDSIDTGGAGSITIYGDTIPTDADTAIVAQTLLATLAFSATSFGAASNGVATAASISDDTSCDATEQANWARWLNGSAATILDCTVGTAGEDINFNTVAFVSGATVSITDLTYTQPKT